MTLQSALTNISNTDLELFLKIYDIIYPLLRTEGKEIIYDMNINKDKFYFKIVREKEVDYYLSSKKLNGKVIKSTWNVFNRHCIILK